MTRQRLGIGVLVAAIGVGTCGFAGVVRADPSPAPGQKVLAQVLGPTGSSKGQPSAGWRRHGSVRQAQDVQKQRAKAAAAAAAADEVARKQAAARAEAARLEAARKLEKRKTTADLARAAKERDRERAKNFTGESPNPGGVIGQPDAPATKAADSDPSAKPADSSITKPR